MQIKNIKYTPIGIIHSPFKTREGVPIQPAGAVGVKGSIILKRKYIAGLKDLTGFSHIILLYHFHLSKGYSLAVVPFMDKVPRGVFATRAPKRPNPIGISVVKLVKIDKNILSIENIDIVDGTPLLDIKPYVDKFDLIKSTKSGWLSGVAKKVHSVKADKRFQ
jgi:tRNA (adenine37-N6)-methyltransferase